MTLVQGQLCGVEAQCESCNRVPGCSKHDKVACTCNPRLALGGGGGILILIYNLHSLTFPAYIFCLPILILTVSSYCTQNSNEKHFCTWELNCNRL